MNILGISAFYHDNAAALARDGAIPAALQEERFSRKKHDNRFHPACPCKLLAGALDCCSNGLAIGGGVLLNWSSSRGTINRFFLKMLIWEILLYNCE